MPYTFSVARSADSIDERKYANGARLKFTTFNSCIGIVGVSSGELTGVHLSLVDDAGSAFDNAAADAAALVMTGCTGIVIFGQVDFWGDCDITPAFDYLRGLLNHPRELDFAGEGRFQATMAGGNPRIARY